MQQKHELSYREILLKHCDRIHALTLDLTSAKRDKFEDSGGTAFDSERSRATAQSFGLAVKALESFLSPFLSDAYKEKSKKIRNKIFFQVNFGSAYDPEKKMGYWFQGDESSQFTYMLLCMDLYKILVSELSELGLFEDRSLKENVKREKGKSKISAAGN